MRETAEAGIITELMSEAKTINMLDFNAVQALYAKRDQAIANGLCDEIIKAHMLSIFIRRWMEEVDPDLWRENTQHPVTVLDNEIVGKKLFFPLGAQCLNALRIPVTDDVELNCHYYRTQDDMPTLVYFHGGHETVADYVLGGYTDLIREFVGTVNVLLIEYRGFGESSGRPRLYRMLRDGHKVLNLLGIPASTCIAYGKSIGSIYAIELTHCCPDLAGIVIESGMANLGKYLLSKPGLFEFLQPHWQDVAMILATNFDQIGKLSRFAGKALILHAMDDKEVSYEEAEQLFDAIQSPDKELRLYDNGEHDSLLENHYAVMLKALGKMFKQAFPDKF